MTQAEHALITLVSGALQFRASCQRGLIDSTGSIDVQLTSKLLLVLG